MRNFDEPFSVRANRFNFRLYFYFVGTFLVRRKDVVQTASGFSVKTRFSHEQLIGVRKGKNRMQLFHHPRESSRWRILSHSHISWLWAESVERRVWSEIEYSNRKLCITGYILNMFASLTSSHFYRKTLGCHRHFSTEIKRKNAAINQSRSARWKKTRQSGQFRSGLSSLHGIRSSN